MTTALRNYYEELIDQMMKDEVCGMDDEIRKELEKLPRNKKRLAILSILDQDRDLFVKIKRTFYKEDVSKTDHISNLVETLREYVKVGTVEKKKFGEVMTPISLVEDMLNTLPKEVWSNPELKWLDPANGCGIFPSVVVKRLMEGLSSWEIDEEKRYRHIVENMLYVCELQPKNTFLFLCSFDVKDEYSLNVHTGSFLDKGFDGHCKEVWGIEKFDVIVGNPPYQEKKNENNRTSPLWDRFVMKSIDFLKEASYLVMVHPSGWRNVDGRFKNTQKLLRSKQIQYLSIHNAKDGESTFGATTRYDWYCLKNTTNNGDTTRIRCEDRSIVEKALLNMEFIPNAMFNEIEKLFADEWEIKVELIHSRSAYGHDKPHMSKIKTEQNIYPCVQNVGVSGKITCIYYSNINTNGHFGIPKVIFGRFGICVLVDNNGEYGIADDCRAIVDERKNLKMIAIALKSKEFKKIVCACDVGGIRDTPINHKILYMFRKDFWKEFV